MALPDWMRPRPDEAADASAVPSAQMRRSRRSFVQKAGNGFAGMLEELLLNAETADRPGLLQSLDPRAKILGCLGLVCVATVVRAPGALIALYIISMAFAAASGIGGRRLARIWLAVPLFTLGFMLPALFNAVTPGRALIVLGALSPAMQARLHLPQLVSITVPGVQIALRMALRTGVCVTLAMLPAATTKAPRLYRGLRSLGVPVLFITLLTMMDRYLAVMARAAAEIHLARISRTPAPGTLRQEHAWIAAGMGSLFRRSQSLGNSVYLAMISRGYTGEVYLLDSPAMRLRDALFLLGAATAAALLIRWGH